MSRLIDLSHIIEDGMITYKGLPAPVICDYLSREKSRSIYEGGDEFQIGKIEMVTNTGTYVDCPFHRYADGKDLSQVALEKFAQLPALVVRVPFNKTIEIGIDYFRKSDLKGKAVLINTDWSKHWRTDLYFENHPFVTEEVAMFLRDQGAVLVGIDSHNIDDTRTKRRPVMMVDAIFQTGNLLILIYATFAFFMTLIREIIKDMEDLKGDHTFGCRTLPIVWGFRKTKFFIYGIIAVFSIVVLLLNYYFTKLPDHYFLIFLFPLLVFLLIRLIRADTKKDFNWLSGFCKIIMILGILSLAFV